MTRKQVIEEENSDQSEIKVNAGATTQESSLSIHIDVDGSHVRVSNDKGVVLDDYTFPRHSFSGGKIGIKTDSQFVVRAN